MFKEFFISVISQSGSTRVVCWLRMSACPSRMQTEHSQNVFESQSDTSGHFEHSLLSQVLSTVDFDAQFTQFPDKGISEQEESCAFQQQTTVLVARAFTNQVESNSQLALVELLDLEVENAEKVEEVFLGRVVVGVGISWSGSPVSEYSSSSSTTLCSI